MNTTLRRRIHPKGLGRVASGIRALLYTVLGTLLLSSGCAKRPEVVATAPPPMAAGPLAKEPGRPTSAQPGLGPSIAEPRTPSQPEGIAASEGPGGSSIPGKAGKEGEAPQAGDAGAASSIPLPPGTEAITPPPSPPREEPVAQVAQLAPKDSPLKDIFFDFDKAEIRQDAKGPLEEDIRWLKAHPQSAITIEGHCDERGTSEYNLGLGERRAKVTKDYLMASGIDNKRIATVSYGKERPFVLGHDESAWKWNRRAHLVVTKE
ncbi:MAG: peptidoglycan-associated lipoprotein Pal [Candidatus Methylomirabilis sp.]